MEHTSEEPRPPQRRTQLPFGITLERTPRVARTHPARTRIVGALTLVALFVLAVHEAAYRESDKGDYIFYGTISHAAGDMIVVSIIVIFSTWVLLAWHASEKDTF